MTAASYKIATRSPLSGELLRKVSRIELVALLKETNRIEDLDLSEADLRDLRFDETTFIGCEFTGADFSGADFKCVSFSYCWLWNTTWQGATIARSEFFECDFAEANCEGLSFSGSLVYYTCLWKGANLKNADFSEAECYCEDDIRAAANLHGTKFPARSFSDEGNCSR